MILIIFIVKAMNLRILWNRLCFNEITNRRMTSSEDYVSLCALQKLIKLDQLISCHNSLNNTSIYLQFMNNILSISSLGN